jgi:hypothetical protein
MESEGSLMCSQEPATVHSALFSFREQTTICPVLVQQQWMLQCSTQAEVKVMTEDSAGSVPTCERKKIVGVQ